MPVSTVFLIFFSLYGALHYYLYSKINGVFYLTLPGALGLIVFFIWMIFTPVAVRMAERNEFDLLTHLLAYTGFMWMGMVFLFFSVSVLFDLYGAAARLLSLLGLPLAVPGRKTAFFASLALALLFSGYGYFSVWQVKTETITIHTAKLGPGEGPLRLALISDVHLGVLVGEARLKRIMQAVAGAKPAVLLSLGDLIDGQLDKVQDALPLLASYNPPLGKYAILGNHEYILGLNRASELTGLAGFRILKDEAVSLTDRVRIVGLDDPAARRFGYPDPGDPLELLEKLPPEMFVLVLKHQPIVTPGTPGRFDLQVSGHTHRGQIFPFYLLSLLAYGYPSGLTDLGQGSRLYVSRGSGTWGPPIRFLAPPEVTVIDLVPAGR